MEGSIHLPYVISSLTFFFVASFVSTSFSMEIVEMLSERNVAIPLLQGNIIQSYITRNFTIVSKVYMCTIKVYKDRTPAFKNS